MTYIFTPSPAGERVNDMDSATYLTLQLGQCLSA